MPNIIPTTSYGWIVSDLRDTSEDLYRIATDTTENITEVEATLAQFHFSKVLHSLILATRLGRRGWPPLSHSFALFSVWSLICALLVECLQLGVIAEARRHFQHKVVLCTLSSGL